ncbi:MAG TPA: histidine phosphatase family protein [Polyangiaceae bacterium]
MSTVLHLARHGETDDNSNKVFQGQHGGGLNARGRAQADRLAVRVAPSIDAVVSSDLQRARETAAIVAAAVKVEVVHDAGLREVDVGAWTGLSHDEVAVRFPEEWGAWRSGVDVPRGGGETYAALATRVRATLDRIAHEHRGRRVLVVSHGAALRSVTCSILGLPPQWSAQLAGMQNTALTTVVYDDDGESMVLTYNDFAHLANLAP